MAVLKTICLNRGDILFGHGYNPSDNALQVRVSLNEVKYNHEGREDFILPASEVETRIERAGTRLANDVDLTIEIYRVE